jgi:hypothetical protein
MDFLGGPGLSYLACALITSRSLVLPRPFVHKLDHDGSLLTTVYHSPVFEHCAAGEGAEDD